MKITTLVLLCCLSVVLTKCSSDESLKKESNSTYMTSKETVDNNLDGIVVIGNKTWMRKNLSVTRFRNGDLIPHVVNPSQWESITQAAWCYPNENAANNAVYGKIYNWYAVADPRGLAPVGWHVATDADWTELLTYVSNNGGNWDGTSGLPLNGNKVAKALASKSYWNTIFPTGTTFFGQIGINANLNNLTGFSALPAVSRESGGSFWYTIGDAGYWWTSTAYNGNSAWYRNMSYNYMPLSRSFEDKNAGYSVRCVKD